MDEDKEKVHEGNLIIFIPGAKKKTRGKRRGRISYGLFALFLSVPLFFCNFLLTSFQVGKRGNVTNPTTTTKLKQKQAPTILPNFYKFTRAATVAGMFIPSFFFSNNNRLHIDANVREKRLREQKKSIDEMAKNGKFKPF